MTRRLTIAVVTLLATLSGTAAAVAELPAALRGPTVIEAKNLSTLREHVGQKVVVTGTIAEAKWSDSGKVMHVRFEGVDPKDFGLFSFSSTRDQFDRGFGGDIAKVLVGSKVRVKGELQTYGGNYEAHADRVEILLRWPNQLTILELAGK